MTATRESTTAGKGRQRFTPAWTLEMKGCNLLLCRADIGVRVGERLSAKTSANAWTAEKPGAESIQEWWHRHRTSRQSSRCQKQQGVDPIGLMTGDLNRNSSPHRGADDSDRTVAGDSLQNTLQMAKNRFPAVLSRPWPWTETETEQVGDKQLKSIAQKWCQTSVFQKTAVESMEQQERWPLAENGHRKWILDSEFRNVPPLQLIGERDGLGIQKIGTDGLELGFQGTRTLGSAAPTRASSNTPGVTGKGRWWRSDPSRQAKSQTC